MSGTRSVRQPTGCTPSIPWESINSTVYHLFYTWCFYFDRSDGDDTKQLWDRRTNLQDEIDTVEALTDRAEYAIVRELWEEYRESLDPSAVNSWLFDGNEVFLPRVKELIAAVSAPTYSPMTRF